MNWFDGFSGSPFTVYALIVILAIVLLAFIVVAFRYGRQQRNILRQEEIDREVARRRRIRVSDKNEVFERDNYTCQICGKKHERLEVHHIVFKSEGGSNSMSNLVSLCCDCHEKIHKGKLVFNKKVKSFKHASHMNIMRSRLIEQLKLEFIN